MVTINTGESERQLGRFSLKTLLLAVFCLCLFFIPARHFYFVWRSMNAETLSVRLLSSGTISWDNGRNATLSIEGIRSHLKDTAILFSSYGMEPHLEIECYSDTRQEDIEKLEHVAREAGFVVTKMRRHGWPSPEVDEN